MLFFHDNQRYNDQNDPDHGRRASQLIRDRFSKTLNLTLEEMNLLCAACEGHNDGQTEGDITVQTCWDSDRLDLWRVGIMPRTEYLCTDAAKEANNMAWAIERSQKWVTDYECKRKNSQANQPQVDPSGN